MKKILLVNIFIYLFVFVSPAQNEALKSSKDSLVSPVPKQAPVQLSKAEMDSLRKALPAMPLWTINERTAERMAIDADTLELNFHRKSMVDGLGVAMLYLGNWGSPAQSKIFSERAEASQFPFLDSHSYHHKTPGKQRFMTTKVPYSNFTYNTGGSMPSKEEAFTTELALSFDKRTTLGFNLEYIYSRGFYQNFANKQINYNVYLTYIGKKNQRHIYVSNNQYTNAENGGILEDGYINGTSSDKGVDKNKTYEFNTRLKETWNRLQGRHVFLSNKYDFGYDRNDNPNDFVPVASAILTNNYADQRRTFYSNYNDSLDLYYNYQYKLPANTLVNNSDLSDPSQFNSLNNLTSYWSFKNTFALKLNEGFRPWVKFGLTAFIEQDIRRYAMPSLENPQFAMTKYNQQSTVIGGILSKEKGKFLKYNLAANFGVLGYNIGESRLSADITTTIHVLGKEAVVNANGYIKNLKPTFFENHFNSKYLQWENNFGDMRRVYVGGEIRVPHTKTRISGGVENIQNYIYYKNSGEKITVGNNVISTLKPSAAQEGGSVQVLTLRVDQNMSYGILHWDNQAVFQKSSNQEVVPLPDISLSSNLYIKATIAKVLHLQLGVDGRYHSAYYAPAYDAAILNFYNQNEVKVGNFPFVNAYANLHLKKTRFFLMMYNVGRNMGNEMSFLAPHYPANPMIFKFGLTWDFSN